MNSYSVPKKQHSLVHQRHSHIRHEEDPSIAPSKKRCKTLQQATMKASGGQATSCVSEGRLYKYTWIIYQEEVGGNRGTNCLKSVLTVRYPEKFKSALRDLRIYSCRWPSTLRFSHEYQIS